MPVETEIKLPLRGEPDDVRAVLARHGYHPSGHRRLEVDQVFDRDGQLRASDQLLRLRTAGSHCTLTYKGPAQRAPYKSREEIEVDVADGPVFIQILTALGFRLAFAYEKYRTKFKAASQPGLVTLDETPIGSFLELEGPGDWIDTTAKLLGYTTEDYVTASYATLYAEHCRTNGGVLSEMRF